MSFLESVLQRTKKLERVLEEQYQATGRGLHEKATSVEHKLDSNRLKQIRFIASVRNKLMHEDGYSFDGTESDFLKKCDDLIKQLTNHQTRTTTYTAPPYIPKPVEPKPHHKPAPVRAASQTSTTGSYRNNELTYPSSSYSKSSSSSGSYSGSNSSKTDVGEVFKNTLRALLIGVFLYPVIGLGGCITRLIVQGSPPNPMTQTQAHDTWLYSPLKAWTTEAIVIPLLIVAITFFVGLIKLNQISPVVKVLLLLLGVAAAIYSGGALINSVRRTRTAAAPVNNSSQAGVVGTMREVNTTNLNMRSGPGANYPVVATFPKKARIVSYGETRNVDGELWTQAATPDGRIRGWVNRKFLSP
ncbi:MAG TPA: SH3 domain-containing protein [Pyrinomonadaceae bacterium]|jgi:hypothetical protein